MPGRLFLIPTVISDSPVQSQIPDEVLQITRNLQYFVVEELRTARRYLSKINVLAPIHTLTFYELNEHTPLAHLDAMLEPLRNGHDLGLISEAGIPAVADPGAALVALAHQLGVRVVPLVGPSSIVLTLMASGLNGQNFAFVGYLPVKADERKQRLKHLEQRARLEQQTQIFIEAPYRNQRLLADILATCNHNTLLTIGCEITSQNQFVVTKTIGMWKQHQLPDLNRRNTVFAILAAR